MDRHRTTGARRAAVMLFALLALAATEAVINPGVAEAAADPAVQQIEQKLTDLRFDPGAVDGVADAATTHAVLAFQKSGNRPRSGQLSADVVDAIMAATAPPAAIVPDGPPTRVEVSLSHQVLQLWENGSLTKVEPVSTGNGERFCSQGACRNAVTPTGTFAVYRQAPGWEYGSLGGLYKPNYFVGGIAIHGAKSVPAEPASHGCVRIPIHAAEWFPGHVPVGTPVIVVN